MFSNRKNTYVAELCILPPPPRFLMYHNARKQSCKSETLFPFYSLRVSLKKGSDAFRTIILCETSNPLRVSYATEFRCFCCYISHFHFYTSVFSWAQHAPLGKGISDS